ncbi:zf-RVT domain-containing protein [Cephalotus follicularis]|uniref:Zf-RVT domain-containing protein n=1 Tax=Cephalotus follicularis TaxID=3775 RepID=A0A1Q3B8S9_CEPFO|nr:zf-RVT domain-containing protein [Cephalotus follicularis]
MVYSLVSLLICYKVKNFENRSTYNVFKSLWSLDVPPRIKTFLWLAVLNSLPMRSVLKNCSIIDNDMCPGCNSHSETVLHILRDCLYSKRIWKQVPSQKLSSSLNSNLGKRVSSLLTSKINPRF